MTIAEPILKPFVHRASLENSRWMGGHLFSFLATGENTGGQLAIMEVQLVAGQEPPLHTHSNDDEAFYVLDGAISFRIGDETTLAQAGEFVLLPRGVEHTFRIIGDSARGLLVSAPSGLEKAFMALSMPAKEMSARLNAKAPDPASLVREFAKHGLTFRSPEQPPLLATANESLTARPALGISRWFQGNLMTPLVNGAKTGGRFGAVEFSAHRNPGPPLHIHTREDETFYVLEGEVRVICGDKMLHARVGDLVFLPRGIPHTPAFVAENTRTLLFITPAGFEEFFEELSAPAITLAPPAQSTLKPDAKNFAATVARYGCEFVAPTA